MLDLIEKIAHGFCALLVVVVGVLYLWWGTPDTEPEELLPKSIESNIPHPRGGGADGDGPKAITKSKSTLDADRLKIMTLLRKNNPQASRSRFERKYLQVQRPTFEYLRNEANWLRQMERIGREDLSTTDGFTRLKLTHMPDNSLLKKLGLRTLDIIELIDGERLSIDDSSTIEHRARARELLDKLEAGNPVTITVTRGGRPVHLEFTLP
jgi:hypothetical protein